MAWPQNGQTSPPVEATSPATQLTPPPIPDGSASAGVLEEQGDELRAQKHYFDSIDYYNTAMKKQPSAMLWNKEGMSYLLLQRPDQAAKCFDHAIKMDKHAAESYNNRGYVEQMKKKYDKAINYYKKAIELRPPTRCSTTTWDHRISASMILWMRESNTRSPSRGILTSSPASRAPGSWRKRRRRKIAPPFRSWWPGCMRKREISIARWSICARPWKMAISASTMSTLLSEFATLRTDKRFEELMAQRPQAIQ
jgi:tetratricopeptide (TPR) repeat protein